MLVEPMKLTLLSSDDGRSHKVDKGGDVLAEFLVGLADALKGSVSNTELATPPVTKSDAQNVFHYQLSHPNPVSFPSY